MAEIELVLSLLLTVLVLQAVQIGIALAAIFIPFFRDFLKAF